MRKHITTLEVYTDNKSDMSAMAERNDGTFELRIGTEKDHTLKEWQSLIAHELGHFVSLITKDPTHRQEFQLYRTLTGDSTLVIPGEKHAWDLAKEMVGDNFDQGQMDRDFGTYTGTHAYNEATGEIEKVI